MDDSRDKDKSHKLIPSKDTRMFGRVAVTMDVLKSAYIAEGKSVKELAEKYYLTEEQVQKIVDDHKLPELRKAYIREGLTKIQNQQIDQAKRLLDLEFNFKNLRLVQLEAQLNDYMAYYGRHGDMYKRHPVSGEILKDTDGIPMQIYVPHVAREIAQLKESVTLSEGLKKLLTDLDDIINGGKKPEGVVDAETIDMEQYEGLFRKKV